MKKLLLIPALLAGTMAMANDYNYEITPQIGFNIAEGNLQLQNYMIVGGELQYNGFDFFLKPELSYMYSLADYEDNLAGYADNADTNVQRFALNGVYEYKSLGFLTPLAKVGLGYETMDDGYHGNNEDSMFIDAGVGAKIPFNDYLALKLEAIYMLKYNADRHDSNLALMAGLNFAFGKKSVEVPVAAVAAPVAVAAVAAVAAPIAASAVAVDGDSDNDGVKNSVDKCPNSAKDAVVNSDGCVDIVNLNINFKYDSFEVEKASEANIAKFAAFLKMAPSYKAEILGHTDSRASEKYNISLSQKRANIVKNKIAAYGVPIHRLSSKGMGETNPIASNKTDAGRAKNRRIEAKLSK